MKYLVLLGDGMADFPLDALDGATPLAAARTPAMDRMAREGLSGLFCPIPEEYPAGSDIGNLSVFGYDPAQTFTGRAPLEAANQGILLADDELAFRCNLVTLGGDSLEDFTAGHISSEEAAELIAALNDSITDEALQFHPGVSYRHLALVRASGPRYDELKSVVCTPPHDIIGRAYAPYLPTGDGSVYPRELMKRSQEVLADHPVNRRRIEAGQSPATSIWLWGQGGAPVMTTYAERFAKTGAVISAVDLVNGIGRLAGLDVISVEGATGYLDTNYEGKVAATLAALENADFAYLHIEAPDEAAHEGNAALKIQAIEDFDRRVVAPCSAWARNRGDVRVLVAPDHVTSVDSRTHAMGPVPFALTGPGVHANGLSAYNEQEASRAGVLYPRGHELVPEMIELAEIRTAVSK